MSTLNQKMQGAFQRKVKGSGGRHSQWSLVLCPSWGSFFLAMGSMELRHGLGLSSSPFIQERLCVFILRTLPLITVYARPKREHLSRTGSQ